MSSYKSKSIRPFLGSKNYAESRAFYQEMGFTEIVLDKKMSLFKVNDNLAFYLQDAYVKDWIENTMVVLEIDDIEACNNDLLSKNLESKYNGVKIAPIKVEHWGKEIHMLDPAGVLWHFCQFS